jgi:TNF receptor-associated protein 1
VDSHDKDFELDLDKPEDEDDKDSRVLTADEQKDFDAFVKSVLKERVQEVKVSDRLVSSPAVVTSMLTPHMRKMMKQMMAGREETGMNNIPMTLEISAKHHVITTLYSIKDSNEVVARMAVEQLYDNACIAAGTLDDPRTLLARLNKVLEMTIYQGAGFDYATNQYISRKEEAPAESAEQPPKDTKPDAQFEEVKIDAKFEEVKTSADGKGAEVKKP